MLRVSCIRGYPIYKDIWDVAFGKVLACEKEPHNVEDHYAIAVKKDDTAIGHLPQNSSKVCSLFAFEATVRVAQGPPWIRQTVSRLEVLSYRHR